MRKAREVFEKFDEINVGFQSFVARIKEEVGNSIYFVINPTLVKNPYCSKFPVRYFFKDFTHKKSAAKFLFNSGYIWAKLVFLLLINFTFFLFYKIFGRRKEIFSDAEVIVDSYLRLDILPQTNSLVDKLYFPGMRESLRYSGNKTLFLPRLLNKNTNNRNFGLLKKLIELIKDSPEDSVVLEFDILSFLDYLKMLFIIFCYPFRLLRALQPSVSSENEQFNACLIEDLRTIDFEAIKRFLIGKKLGKLKQLKTVISWCEFQAQERGFFLGIRQSGSSACIVGCQFYLNYLAYLNSFPETLDHNLKFAPDVMLVNGKAFLRNVEKIDYKVGVALRYQKVFSFEKKQIDKASTLPVFLASYIVQETIELINYAKSLNTKIILKLHPTQKPEFFKDEINSNIVFAENSIYDLFEENLIFISTASGSAVEAVACGKTVVIVGSRDNLTANPLIETGRGEIWDIVFEESEMLEVMEKLVRFRSENPERIEELSNWYKENFFERENKDYLKFLFV